jgi:hypothetical protein
MITKEEYTAAIEQHKASEEVIQQYHRERLDAFAERMKSNPIFTDDELIYSAMTLCPCGHGIAYPKDCGGNHYWDCSAILKGIADENIQHTGQLPFMMYDVKGESKVNGSTRGVFLPQVGDSTK